MRAHFVTPIVARLRQFDPQANRSIVTTLTTHDSPETAADIANRRSRVCALDATEADEVGANELYVATVRANEESKNPRNCPAIFARVVLVPMRIRSRFQSAVKVPKPPPTLLTTVKATPIAVDPQYGCTRKFRAEPTPVDV